MISTPDSIQQGNKINAEDYLQRVKIVDDRDKPLNPVVSTILSVAAKLALVVFIVYTFLRAQIRHTVYFVERNTIFRNRTPQQVRQDVAELPKIPNHIAFVLDPPKLSLAANSNATDILPLIEQCVQCLSWVVGVGASQVTLYERSGLLKSYPLEGLHEALRLGLAKQVISGDLPTLVLRSNTKTTGLPTHSANTLIVTLQSEQDGRPMLVHLANELKSEVSGGVLDPKQITVDKIHEEVLARVGNEPDMLITFGSYLDVEQFSPWLLRVTELFCLPDNNGVFHYMVFYRALQKFANVKVNLGA